MLFYQSEDLIRKYHQYSEYNTKKVSDVQPVTVAPSPMSSGIRRTKSKPFPTWFFNTHINNLAPTRFIPGTTSFLNIVIPTLGFFYSVHISENIQRWKLEFFFFLRFYVPAGRRIVLWIVAMVIHCDIRRFMTKLETFATHFFIFWSTASSVQYLILSKLKLTLS